MTKTVAVGILCVVCKVAFGQESPHGAIRFECAMCHGTDSWTMKHDATFKHETTGFVLAGQHKTLQCAACHRGLKFEKMKSTCTSCHTDVHKGEHGIECAKCHSLQSFHIADMIQRHQQTRFPLLGRHATLECQACHARASVHQYTATPTTCIGCHRQDFQSARTPDHLAAGFTTECVVCHQVSSMRWGGSFDHALTAFPLTGAHRATLCQSCHVNQVFRGTSSECYACHRNDYTGAMNPNHVASSFPTTCQVCHTTTAWQGATFDHGATRFALTGAHRATPCQSCHVNGNYQLTYTDCYPCHVDDFQRPTDPNHVAANFSHDCTPCHVTTAWLPSTFNHDQQYFRIYSGQHRNRWTNCQQCHPTVGNFQDFACISCHEHRQSEMDNKHRNVSGYVYASPSCYNCHRGV
jgi:hypothetical protein